MFHTAILIHNFMLHFGRRTFDTKKLDILANI